MSDVNRVRLVVGGQEFGGWKSVRIEAGIDRAARSFALGVTRSWPGSTPMQGRVRPGDLCEVWIGPDKVLTGYVDATPIRYDARSYTVEVRGRSRTADLVDCSAINAPGQWRGQRLEVIARAMAGVYGVDVVAQASTGAVVREHQIEPGETVFESLDRLLTVRQMLAADDGDGRLVLLTPGSGGRAGTALELGVNILSGGCELDHAQVFSEYVCKAQRATVDDEDVGAMVTEQVGRAADANVRRRVLVIKQAGQADAGSCQQRAEYERDYRLARAREASYSVQGWRQADGALWQCNRMVRVRDGLMGIDEDMLITEVVWSLTEEGSFTDLVVCPPSGYVRKAAAAKKAKGTAVETWADIK